MYFSLDPGTLGPWDLGTLGPKKVASSLAIDEKSTLFIYNYLAINGERPKGSNNALPRVSARRAAQPGGKQPHLNRHPGGVPQKAYYQ